jgi:hypothetical protein
VELNRVISAASVSPPKTPNTGELGLSGVRNHARRGLRRLAIFPLDARLSERAEEDRADEHEDRENHDDVELQGNVHEGGSMAIYDEDSLPEKRRSARDNHGALQ